MVISLGGRLLGPSSGLPGSRWRAGPTRRAADRETRPANPCPLFDLAPGGVCLAKPVARPAGELLPHRFTLTRWASPRGACRAGRSAFCCTFPGLAAGGRYPSPCPAEPGLSSRRPPRGTDYAVPEGAGQRPSSSLGAKMKHNGVTASGPAPILKERFEVLFRCLLTVKAHDVSRSWGFACELVCHFPVLFGFANPLGGLALHKGPCLSQ